MRNEHGPRAALPHVTPMGDNCVSACARTAMAVQVRRTISPFRATYLDTGPNSRSGRPFSDAQAVPSLWIEVDNANCADASDPTYRSGEVEVCEHARSHCTAA